MADKIKIVKNSLRKQSSARWQDPESLAALEECKQIEANPGAYKSFSSIEELIADLEHDDDDDEQA